MSPIASATRRGDGAGWTQGAASLGFALVQLDVTVVNVALPRLGSDLGAGISGLQWIVDGYALVFAVMLLIGGFLGDRFGARRLYIAGVGLFASLRRSAASRPTSSRLWRPGRCKASAPP